MLDFTYSCTAVTKGLEFILNDAERVTPTLIKGPQEVKSRELTPSSQTMDLLSKANTFEPTILTFLYPALPFCSSEDHERN